MKIIEKIVGYKQKNRMRGEKEADWSSQATGKTRGAGNKLGHTECHFRDQQRDKMSD